jgi:catechol 2,3-dioxygenase-like lactoylglutathione lyase family enzyme
MLDHISISVLDLPKSIVYYDTTLKILGYDRLVTLNTPEYEGAAYGHHGKTFFWISPMGHGDEFVGRARGFHLAFTALSPESIDLWYSTALSLGALDNGKPGPRAHYHPSYYGAFVVDLNGWRTEACVHL